jgi:hypothetical protein
MVPDAAFMELTKIVVPVNNVPWMAGPVNRGGRPDGRGGQGAKRNAPPPHGMVFEVFALVTAGMNPASFKTTAVCAGPGRT